MSLCAITIKHSSCLLPSCGRTDALQRLCRGFTVYCKSPFSLLLRISAFCGLFFVQHHSFECVRRGQQLEETEEARWLLCLMSLGFL